MPSLSSLLVQREAAPMRAVEDAIARQVMHGGDLATNLLELGAVREDTLLGIVADSHGLEAAPPGPLAMPAAEVLRVVPGELALRHGIFPIDLVGRTLLLATAEPLEPSVEDDLSFALDVAISQRLSLLVRIRQAIALGYGIPLDRRLLRLVARLEGRTDPSPSSLPPPNEREVVFRMPRHVSVPAPTFGTGLPTSGHSVTPLGLMPPVAPGGVPRTPVVAGDAPSPIVPGPPAMPLGLEPLTPSPEPAAEPAAPTPFFSSVPSTTRAAEPAKAADTAVPPRAAAARTRALAGFLRQAIADGKKIDKTAERDIASPQSDAPPKPGRAQLARAPARVVGAVRRKGPFTAAMAEAELDAATGADEVFDVLFAFAQQFFEYAALFVVHGDLAEGRAASGPGKAAAKIAGIGVALDLPSAFATARERRGPFVGRFATDGLDAEIARDLGRAPSARAALVLPLVVRTRCVGLLYGDDGESDVALGSLGDVVALTGLAGKMIERLALKRKLGPGAEATPLPRIVARPGAGARAASLRGGMTPTPTGGAQALVRAFELPAREKSSDPPPPREPQPPPRVSPGAESVRTPEIPAPMRATMMSPTDPEADAAQIRSSDPPHEIADEDSGENIPKAIARISSVGDDARVESSKPEPLPSTKSDAPRRRAGTEPGLGIVAAMLTPPTEPPAPASAPVWPERRERKLPTPPPPSVDEPFAEHKSLVEVPERDHAAPVVRRVTPQLMPQQDPVALALTRRRSFSERPLRREEEDSSGSDSIVAAMDSSPSPPHRFDIPPRSRPISVPPLPSVIVDVAAEYASLLQRMLEGGPGSQEAFAELVRHGEQAVQVLMAKFPGPLRVDRHRMRAELPAASQCGPLLEVLVAIRRPSLPFVTVRTSSPDVETRFWATHVLGELRYPEAANALVPRLFDDDLAVRRIARRSAASLVDDDAGAPILQGLDHMVRSPDQPVPYRVLAIETMGEIRTAALVPPLIAVLSEGPDEVAEAARRALLVLARQDFGRDVRRWNEWWHRNSNRHRIEWLIDALMHDQPAVRRAAGDELKQLTKEYFGYYDDLPKKERERAHGLYRAWWEKEGRRRFGEGTAR